MQGITATPTADVSLGSCNKMIECCFAGTFVLVGIMLVITPKQQQWVWVLTEFNVRQLLLPCCGAGLLGHALLARLSTIFVLHTAYFAPVSAL